MASREMNSSRLVDSNPVYVYFNITRTPPLTKTGGPTVNTGVLLI